MSTKLDSLILSSDVIEKMRIDLYNTYKNDKEHGFSLCTEPNSNIMVDREHCIGDKCRIRLQRKCNQNEKFVGSYHTHPGGRATISGADFMTSCLEDVSCIGGDYNKIKCHIRKKLQPEWRDIAQKLVCYHEAEEFYRTKDLPMNKRLDDIKLEADRLRTLVNRSIKGEIVAENLHAQISGHNNNIKQFNKDSLKLQSILDKLINQYFDIRDVI